MMSGLLSGLPNAFASEKQFRATIAKIRRCVDGIMMRARDRGPKISSIGILYVRITDASRVITPLASSTLTTKITTWRMESGRTWAGGRIIRAIMRQANERMRSCAGRATLRREEPLRSLDDPKIMLSPRLSKTRNNDSFGKLLQNSLQSARIFQ